jgi:sugar phosphate isomerase/epimerase
MNMSEVSKIPPGLQLYTVRNELKSDFFGTLKKIADMGYQNVEFIPASRIGTEDIQAVEQRKALDRLGLMATSTQISFDDLVNRLNEQIQFALIIGAKFIVLSRAPEEVLLDEKNFQELIVLLKKAGNELKKNGLQLAYHNHAVELRKVNGSYILDRIFDNVESDLLKAELDLGWIKKAGADPNNVLKSYKGRVELLHVKDVDKAGNFTEVGRGDINYRGILSTAVKMGVKYYFVEQDDSPHPLESAKISLDFLKSFGWM